MHFHKRRQNQRLHFSRREQFSRWEHGAVCPPNAGHRCTLAISEYAFFLFDVSSAHCPLSKKPTSQIPKVLRPAVRHAIQAPADILVIAVTVAFTARGRGALEDQQAHKSSGTCDIKENRFRTKRCFSPFRRKCEVSGPIVTRMDALSRKFAPQRFLLLAVWSVLPAVVIWLLPLSTFPTHTKAQYNVSHTHTDWRETTCKCQLLPQVSTKPPYARNGVSGGHIPHKSEQPHLVLA